MADEYSDIIDGLEADGGLSAPTPQPGPTTTPQPTPSPTPALPDAEDTDYSDIVRDLGPSDTAIRQAAYVAKRNDPDRAAKIVKLSEEMELPQFIVEKNYDILSKQREQNSVDYADIIEQTPGMAQWLSEPNNAAISIDDVPQLQKIGKGVKFVSAPPKEETTYKLLRTPFGALPIPSYATNSDLSRAAQTGIHDLDSSTTSLAVAYGWITPEDAAARGAEANKKADALRNQAPDYAKEFNKVMEENGYYLQAAVDKFGASFNELRRGKILEGLIAFNEGRLYSTGSLLQYLGSAIVRPRGLLYATTEQIANSAPAIASGALGGAAAGLYTGPGAVVASPGGFVLGSFAGELATEIGAEVNGMLRQRGVDVTNPESLAAAYKDPVLMADIRSAAERKGFGTALANTFFNAFAGRIKVGGRVASAVADTGVQMAGESVSEAAGQVAREAGKTEEQLAREGKAGTRISQRISPGDIMLEGIVSMGHSVGQVATAKTLQTAGITDPVRSAETVVRETKNAMESAQGVQALEQLGSAIGESKTAQRIPEKIKSLIDSTLMGQPAAVYFQANDWDDYWSSRGKSPAKAAEQIFEDGGKKYFEAKSLGVNLEIPLSDYLAKVSQTEDFDGLNQVVRVKPDSQNLQEASDTIKNLPGTMEEIARAADEYVKGRSSDTVRQRAYEDLKAAGVDETEARAQSQILEARYSTRAATLGVSPMDLYNVRFEKGETAVEAQGQVLEQKALPVGVSIESKPFGRLDTGIAFDPKAHDVEVVAKDENGKVIGFANFFHSGRELFPFEVNVDEKHRRKGIATALYNKAEELTGKKVSPSNENPGNPKAELSDDAKAFWEARRSKTFEQGGPTSPRGRIILGDNQAIIQLFKEKNRSTVIHETGHLFLSELAEDYATLKAKPETERTFAQNQLVKDGETILNFLGVESFDDIKTEHHEKFAEQWERYAIEGKAPTSELRQAFTRFKVWLLSIYLSIKNIGVELTPEVRDVFDRMLATQEEIDAARLEMNAEPAFKDPAAFGMTGEKGDRYIKASIAWQVASHEYLEQKLLKDLRRMQTETWKAEREKVKAQVTERVYNMPAYKTILAMEKGETPEGVKYDPPPPKLSKEAIVSQYGPERAAKLPKSILVTKVTGEGGVVYREGTHPDLAAEMYGFRNGTELLDALEAAPPVESVIEAMTDQEMMDRHPELVSSPEVAEEAIQALHNDERAKVLRMELEHLASNDLPVLKDVIRQVTRKPPSDASVKEQAARIIGSKKVSEINPRAYQLAEARAAKQAGEAVARGDFDAAFEAKQRELLNHELYRAAIKAKDFVEDTLDRVKPILKKDADMAKTREMDLVNAARAVLANFALGRTDKTAADYLDPIKRYDPDTYSVVQTLVESVGTETGDYRDRTYDQFTAMAETVSALWDLSKTTKQNEVEGQKVDRDQVVDDLSARTSELAAKEKKRPSKALGETKDMRVDFMGLRAALRRVESWVDAMDGGNPDGVFRKYIWTPISEATAKYRSEKVKYYKRWTDLIAKHYKTGDLTGTSIAAPELAADAVFKDKAALIHALLHSGNESNLSKLLRGYGWGQVDENGILDKSRWNAFLKRAESSGLITKNDWDFVQGVWDLFDEMKPMTQAAHKAMYGHYFNEITANEVETSFGTYRGGYVPAKADLLRAEDANIRAEQESLERMNNSSAFPTTGRGATKSRIEAYAAPLELNIARLAGHIDWALKFSILEPRIKEVSRIVFDKRFRSALGEIDQAVAGDMLVPWLQRTAQQRVETPSRGRAGKWMDNAARQLRQRTGLQILSLNITNALQNFTNVSTILLKVKRRHVRDALWEYVRAPSDTAEWISGKSKFMETKMSNVMAEVQTTMDDLLLDPDKYEKARDFAKKHGYFLSHASQSVMDSVSWLSAYNQSIEQGRTEKQAIRDADSVVRQVQGSGAPEDISRFESGSPIVRLFTQFQTFFNTQANLLGTEFGNAYRNLGMRKGAGRMAYIWTFGFMIPAVMNELIVKAMAGRLDEDDDDEYLDDFMQAFFGGQMRYATALMPVVGPAIQAGINAWNNKWYDDRISTSPSIAMLESAVSAPRSVYKAISDDMASKKKAIRDTLTLLGLLSNLPLAPLSRPLGYLADVEQGRVRPSGPLDFTRGLLTGRGAPQ